jgi:receptor protein-tyrosine kinase
MTMSLIERAAERLERLAQPTTKQEVPPPADPGEVDNRITPEPTLSTPERLLAVLESDQTRQEPFIARQAVEAPVEPRSRPATQLGRRIELDLEGLAARGLITPAAPTSRIANEFRVIKRPLIANLKGKSAAPVDRANLIMVTSALPGEGKSFSAINLAMSIAMEMDSTVLLVDGDVAGPSLARVLGLPQAPGLTELLSERHLSVADVLLKTNVPKLSIIPAGEPHERNTELLASQAMNSLLDEMALRYPDRIIVFDSPPLLPTTESRVLATHMGQIIVIVEAERTTHRQVADAMATIESCPVVMAVLNKASASGVGDYYGQYAYSGSGA